MSESVRSKFRRDTAAPARFLDWFEHLSNAALAMPGGHP